MVSLVTARPRRPRPDKGPRRSAPRTKRDVVTEFRTAEIRRAALHVFAERGFDGATIAEIANLAGVAKGTVYLYYPSKRRVYVAALRRGAADLAEAAAAAMAGRASAAAQLRGLVESALGYFEEHRDFLRLYCAEAWRALCSADAAVRRGDDGPEDLTMVIEPVLRRGMGCRSVRRIPPEAAAAAALDIVRGVASRRLREGGRSPLADDAALAFDLIWKGIGRS